MSETDQLCETCKEQLAQAARDAGSEPRLVVLDCRTFGVVSPVQVDGKGSFEGTTYAAQTAQDALAVIGEIRHQLPVGERFLVLTGCAGAH